MFLQGCAPPAVLSGHVLTNCCKSVELGVMLIMVHTAGFFQSFLTEREHTLEDNKGQITPDFPLLVL